MSKRRVCTVKCSQLMTTFLALCFVVVYCLSLLLICDDGVKGNQLGSDRVMGELPCQKKVFRISTFLLLKIAKRELLSIKEACPLLDAYATPKSWFCLI